MSSVARALAPPQALLEGLSLALEASDPARAVRDALLRAGLPALTRERIFEQALRVGLRARQANPVVSRCELQLSLGVVLVLCGALAGATAES
ncbi:MAG TPA: hypothetical protein VNW92_01640 [Polyangiaceae bacterium]|jgi:hypothetical protein|nr:hypothetical protein [Polyangiaceae bacterium]